MKICDKYELELSQYFLFVLRAITILDAIKKYLYTKRRCVAEGKTNSRTQPSETLMKGD
jgi:hypothetical protein